MTCCPNELTLVDIEGVSCEATTIDPCGGTGSVDVITPNDLTDCGMNPIELSVTFYSTEGFADVTVNGDNIEFTSADTALPGVVYTIKYTIKCGDYLGTASLTVCFEDLCDGVSCDPLEHCDPCDGNCVEDEIDLGVTITGTII